MKLTKEKLEDIASKITKVSDHYGGYGIGFRNKDGEDCTLWITKKTKESYEKGLLFKRKIETVYYECHVSTYNKGRTPELHLEADDEIFKMCKKLYIRYLTGESLAKMKEQQSIYDNL